jgi:hypothetical protein
LWKVTELWKNQRTVFPQFLGPSVHTFHNAGCYWSFRTQHFFYSFQRETKEVLAELVEKLRGTLELKATSASQGEARQRPELSPNLDRLTVGVDLGDQWSRYCILGLQGETLNEGPLQMRQEEIAEFFHGLPPTRVVIEVGTHSAWVQEIIAGKGHEVLVANPPRGSTIVAPDHPP